MPAETARAPEPRVGSVLPARPLSDRARFAIAADPPALPQAARSARRELLGRAALDRGLALLLLVPLSPVMLMIAAIVRLDSPGKALFAQHRIGLGGQPFRMLKFRSMHEDAERLEDSLISPSGGPFFKVRRDARVTPFGRFMRRLSLDELPQLLNVLRGEMRLVGPRPLLVREYRDLPVDVQEWRFRVKPGLTGLWQVSGRSNTTASTRLRLDRIYVENAGLGLDLHILARTPAAVFRAEGAV
jgi:lipopolysaccharide/colanic/teichoic acid biosynthesis glycosyltransferase